MVNMVWINAMGRSRELPGFFFAQQAIAPMGGKCHLIPYTEITVRTILGKRLRILDA